MVTLTTPLNFDTQKEYIMSTAKITQLAALAQTLQNLTESPLYEDRIANNYKPVLGEGDPDADILFIGEAPGAQEAKTGRPFVGASGKLLDELLGTISLSREQVYITNIVKDRPPDNRDPRAAEIKLYTPLLIQQLSIIQPKVIATLGRFSMEFIFKQFDMAEKGQKIRALRGQVLAATAEYGQISVVPLFHPAVALYNSRQRATLQDDFQVLRQFIVSDTARK